MNYRTLGRSGARISPICLGTMMFGGQTDEADSTRIIHHAIDAGINFIDSANMYNMGESEHALFLSFPATTAWMVYGMWFAPVFYIATYVIYFPTHILTDADMEKFREILAQKDERDSNNHESGGAS